MFKTLSELIEITNAKSLLNDGYAEEACTSTEEACTSTEEAYSNESPEEPELPPVKQKCVYLVCVKEAGGTCEIKIRANSEEAIRKHFGDDFVSCVLAK